MGHWSREHDLLGEFIMVTFIYLQYKMGMVYWVFVPPSLFILPYKHFAVLKSFVIQPGTCLVRRLIFIVEWNLSGQTN